MGPRIVSTRDMRAYEINSEALGVPTIMLMENAGASVARVVEGELEEVSGKRIAIIAGKGGKAGDGFVAARHLAALGAKVRVYLLYPPETVKHPDASRNLDILSRTGDVELTKWRGRLSGNFDVVIDAMLGTGTRGMLRDPVKGAVEQANEAQGLKVAIDLPTGVDPDTGEILGTAFRADITVTMHAAKPGLLRDEAREYVGRLVVANIGMPPRAWTHVGPGDVAARIPRRPRKTHKGMGGRVLVIGGSASYIGAPWLSALAALAGGADLVYLYTPQPVARHRFSPEVIVTPLEGDILEERHVDMLVEAAGRADAIVVGPGVGLARETFAAVAELLVKLAKLDKPVVVDADALKVVGRENIRLTHKFILTPHLGEASRLLGEEVEDELEPRVGAAERIAEKYGSVVLLKGWVDVIAGGGREARLNETGVPEMSVGGTGDVLAGLAAAFACKTLDAREAAEVAAYVNGIAGMLAYRREGAAMPTALLRHIPIVLRDPVAAHHEAHGSGNA